jgi:uncharacterized protein (TIGR00255 family)
VLFSKDFVGVIASSEVGVLLSMTGYGEARFQNDQLALSIELRALNNRYLKVSVRAPDPYHLLEAEFEKVIRRFVKRGTLQVQLRCERRSALEDFRINPVALSSYAGQIKDLAERLGLGQRGDALLAQVLTLPGVVPEPGSLAHSLHDDWPLIEKVLLEALERLQHMRQEEGRAMAGELLAQRSAIADHLDIIRQRAGGVASAFRDRLHERVKTLLSELDVEIDRNDLIREVSIFAERSDIAEEVVRLAAHLDHFQEIMNEKESPGRKLEFLNQEMSREANTIGSKAGDVEISRQVVEIKGILEKIRELIQNVE